MKPSNTKRLHLGCGNWTPKGWINADIRRLAGIDLVCDARRGLPLADASIDYAVSVHALQEMTFAELCPVLREIRRVLKPSGVLRLCLPDLDKGLAAYQRGEREYFAVPDEDASTLGGKFIMQILWYGYSKVMFTHEFIEELLLKAGFSRVHRCGFRETRSPWGEIVDLDNREKESLFVEAVKEVRE